MINEIDISIKEESSQIYSSNLDFEI